MIAALHYFLATAAFAGVNFAQEPATIVGGQTAGKMESINGAVVSVKTTLGACTGTALSQKVILTAAHCHDLGGGILKVEHTAGTRAFCDSAEVESVEYSPDATVGVMGIHMPDILLVRLKTALCGISPAHLKQTPIEAQSILTVAGYGIGTQSSISPDRIEIRVAEQDKALEQYNDQNELPPTEKKEVEDFIRGSKGYLFAFPVVAQTSLCHGDSGGPVYLEEEGKTILAGVNGAIFPHSKFGAPGCNGGYLQLFTPVTPYLDWLRNKIDEWE